MIFTVLYFIGVMTNWLYWLGQLSFKLTNTICVVHDTTQGLKIIRLCSLTTTYIFFFRNKVSIAQLSITLLSQKLKYQCWKIKIHSNIAQQKQFFCYLFHHWVTPQFYIWSSLRMKVQECRWIMVFVLMQKVAYFIIIHFVRQWSVNNSI